MLQLPKTIAKHKQADARARVLHSALTAPVPPLVDRRPESPLADTPQSPIAGPSRPRSPLSHSPFEQDYDEDGDDNDGLFAAAPGVAIDYEDQEPDGMPVDELDVTSGFDDFGIPPDAHYLYDRIPSNIHPVPGRDIRDTLPPFASQYVHHHLPSSARMVFTQAAVSSILGADHDLVASHINFSQKLLDDAGQPLPKPAANPADAYAQLGMSPDAVIERYAVCEIASCSRLCKFSNLHLLSYEEGHQDHTGAKCEGKVYIDKGSTRQALKVMPFTPPSTMLQTYLRDPQFVRALQEWRGGEEEDQVGDKTPIEPNDFPLDLERPMNSVFDGSFWRYREAYIRRDVLSEAGPRGEWVRDVVTGPSQRLVSLEFGMLAVLNVDWYVVHESCGIANCTGSPCTMYQIVQSELFTSRF